MEQQKTKVERFADYINGLSFSDVISLFNSLSQTWAESEGYADYSAMYDYTVQNDAEWMLKATGVEEFLKGVNNPTVEERAYLCDVMNGCELFVNPWTETLEYATEFIKTIENAPTGHYEEAKSALSPKVKFKFAIHCTLTKIVYVEDYDIGSAEMQLEDRIAVDPPIFFDGPGEYSLERLQD